MLRRGLVSIANTRSAAVKTVSLIPGDGVGPELMASVKVYVRFFFSKYIFFQEVFTSASVPVQFEEVGLTGVNTKEGAYEEAIASILKNGVCLMGALENAQAAGLQQSMNFQLRNDLGVFGAVANIKSIEGLQSKFSNVDIVAIRETAEGEYKCLEHEPVPGVVEALKITTEANSDRIHKVILFLVFLNSFLFKVRFRLCPSKRPKEGHMHPQGEHHEEGRRSFPPTIPRGGEAVPDDRISRYDR